jgi:hypothetical protein
MLAWNLPPCLHRDYLHACIEIFSMLAWSGSLSLLRICTLLEELGKPEPYADAGSMKARPQD